MLKRRNPPRLRAAIATGGVLTSLGAAAVFAAPRAEAQVTGAATYRFDFGSGKAVPGYTAVLPGTFFSPERGYGFEPGATVNGVERGGKQALHAHFVTSDRPFLFSVALPEGNYNVTITLGDRGGESTTTVKAEARRLMLEKVQTGSGEVVTRTFTVNVHNRSLKSGGTVRLKHDEQTHLDWDGKLTLEFNGARPCVDAVEITPAPNAVTVYIAGDSTVTDQGKEPWAAWGQMLPRFFRPGVAVANIAESGETLRSFLGEHRLEKITDGIKAGDYLLIQFGHNDQKPGANEPIPVYQDLLRQFIAEARQRKAIPVLVTSMNRRRFDSEGKIIDTLAGYPDAVRQVAKEQNVPLIDLNAMSRPLFEALGPEGTLKAFVHYPAGTFPGQTVELKDDTHFNAYGAYELAKCVVAGIKAVKLGLAASLTDDVSPFDPAHPDPVVSWHLPASPSTSDTKPEGS